MLEAETSTHFESASASHRGAAASLLDQLVLHGDSVANGKYLQVSGRGKKHFPLKCQRQRRARTVPPPTPRTVEQPHACSISRSFIAAPLHSQTPADAWSRQQALSTQVPEAETNMDFESASALHRGAAASLHNQSELGGGSDTKPHICLQVPCRGGKQVLHSSAIGRDKHGRSVCLRFAPWSSRKLARSDGA